MLQRFFNTYAKDIKSNEEIEHLTKKLQTKLQNILQGEDLVEFNKYEDARTEETQLLTYESFRQGFRASILLMLEVMQG